MTLQETSRKRRQVTLAAAGLLTAVVLVGCATPGSTPTPTPTPIEGGVLTVASNNDVKPALVLAGQQANWAWELSVFETLTSYDENSVPQPLLATDWTIAEDGLSIDITLRDDVTFHSGRAMTASDVKFSFEATLDPAYGSQLAFISKQFTAITVESDTELSLEFATPLPNVFDFFEQTVIIDSETAAGLKDGTQVIGTGPFVWDSWDPGTKLSLVRNDDYWGERPHLDGIDVAVITDTTAMVNAVRSGRVNYAIGLPGIDVAGFENDPQYALIPTTGSLYPLGMDVTAAPFDNVDVRQAVNFAIDRERIVDQVFGGLAQVSNQFWNPNSPGYDPSLNEVYPYDPEKAKQMIEDAGATGASFEIVVIGFGPNASAAEIVRNNLEAVGLNPTVNVLEIVDFQTAQLAGDLGPMFMPLHGLGFSPPTLISSFPSLRAGNPSNFDTPEYQELRAALLSASDDEVVPATEDLAAYIADQAFSVPLVYAPGYVVATPNVHGVRPSVRAYADFKSAYFSE
jgi:peptide/nickel transport system substrate-binding protein